MLQNALPNLFAIKDRAALEQELDKIINFPEMYLKEIRLGVLQNACFPGSCSCFEC